MPATSVRKTKRTDTGPGTSTGTSNRPSPLLRLDRVLAILAERVEPRDRTPDDDPWPDLPEELEPIDEDALDEADLLLERAQRRRPVMTFSLAPAWALPSDAEPAEPVAVLGDLRVTVRRPRVGFDGDPLARDLVVEELEQIAVALDQLQGGALRAASRAEAFDRLAPRTQKDLAIVMSLGTPEQLDSLTEKERKAAASSTQPKLSKRRREIIEAPWGLAPLEFFWWKRAQGLDLTEAVLLAEILASEPDIAGWAAARRVADATCAPSQVAARTDAIRQQVPVLRSLLPILPTLNMLAGALTEFDFEELDDLVEGIVEQATGVALEKRGRGLVHLALAGAFCERQVSQ